MVTVNTDKKAGVVKALTSDGKANTNGLKKLKAANEKTGLVIIQCTCKNVHIEGGVVLNASRRDSRSNWKNGDYAAVPEKTAKMLDENEQAVIV